MSKLVCKEIQSKTSGIVIPVEDLAQLSQTLEGMRSSGISSWVDPQTSGYNYAAKALVWFDNNVYQLNVANSVQDPTGADWSLVDISSMQSELDSAVQASEITQTTGDSTTLIMSQDAVTKAIEQGGGGGPLPTIEVVQTLGDSVTAVMSQDAVTKALAALGESGDLSELYTGAYGLLYDNASDTYIRTGATGYAAIPSMMRRVVLKADGSVNYYLDAHNSNFKKDLTLADLTGADGNVMVEVPAFFVKFTTVGSSQKMEVSLTEDEGFTRHRAFYKAGIPVANRYAPAYRGFLEGSKLRSASGKIPTMSRTLPQFRLDCQANGAGWHLQDYELYQACALLCFIEIGTFDTQKVLGNGNSEGSTYARITGVSNTIGNGNSNPSTVGWMSWRGIEDFYGSSWQNLDGVNIKDRVVFTNNNHLTFASDVFTDDYTTTGITMPTASSAYIRSLSITTRGLIPIAVGGSSSTYMADTLDTTTGNMAARVGGAAGHGLACGASALSASLAASFAAAAFGAGLAF